MNPQTSSTVRSGYAPVNGLDMYYEIHGTGQPLVLLHGAMSGIETSFGSLLPTLAETRQVIAVELQAHGRTADVDRPLTLDQMAEDVAALLRYISIENADIFGYSMGAAVGLYFTLQHPEIVRKLIMASVSYRNDGLHPGLLEMLQHVKPEQMIGTPWQEEYARIAPRPEDWTTLVTKVIDLDMRIPDLPADSIRSIDAPVLLIVADSDIIRLEHAVEIFRLLGGGVSGDNVGLPKSQLAILPGTSHTMVPQRADLLLPMIPRFLDAPMP
jgi:pimeloyl-ACP methyl ester carboxylesterase